MLVYVTGFLCVDCYRRRRHRAFLSHNGFIIEGSLENGEVSEFKDTQVRKTMFLSILDEKTVLLVELLGVLPQNMKMRTFFEKQYK